MTPQEKSMIDGLVERVNQAKLTEKDPEAEQLLQAGLGRNPDAVYILAQTVLVQGYALEQAQRQLADARAELETARQQPKKSTSFLGSLLGHDDPAPPPPPRPAAPQPGSPQAANAGYAPVPNYAPPSGYTQTTAYPQAPAQYAPQSSFGGGGGGGFLRGAMQTAAGVAAGALAFQGVESLMHGFGHSAGYGSDMALGGFGNGGGPREEIVNNYYGDSGDRDSGGLSPDIEDRRGDSGDRFASDNDTTDYGTDGDDTGSDDTSSFDDSGSFDDGGGSFDGGGDDNNV